MVGSDRFDYSNKNRLPSKRGDTFTSMMDSCQNSHDVSSPGLPRTSSRAALIGNLALDGNNDPVVAIRD